MSKRMGAMLDAVEPSVIKLRSLAAKGQVFKFPDYAKCRFAVEQLAWQFDRLVSFRSIIEMPSLNWEHPEVRGLLIKLMEIEPEQIQESIGQNNSRSSSSHVGATNGSTADNETLYRGTFSDSPE